MPNCVFLQAAIALPQGLCHQGGGAEHGQTRRITRVNVDQNSSDFTGFSAAALRMIDANFNRAAEGLRVIEDYCRFGLNDRHLSGLCKDLRHELTKALAGLPTKDLASTRETQRDVGTSLTTKAEGQRQSLLDISAAACQRVQQALRVIEECLKIANGQAAIKVEALRYQTYTLAKALLTTAVSSNRLAHARLYVLVDGKSSECAFAEHVETLVAAGVDILQLRDKQLDDRKLLERARLLRRVLDEAARQEPCPPRPLFIVNDRPDIAVLARADGVHVGQEELPVHEVRQIVGPQLLIGVSTHSIEQARQAVLDGANYIGCGPVFPSATKQFDRFPGLDFLRQVASEIALPGFAIGGITANNVTSVLQTGCRRVAVSSAVTESPDVLHAAATLKTILNSFGQIENG